MNENYVTHSQCEEHRDALEKKILENSLKLVELETTLKALVNTNRMILASVVGGIITIVITLLTRGL